MCKFCVLQPFVDRGNACYDNGQYLVNFKQCAKCHKRALLIMRDKKTVSENTEEEGEETTITFDHHCSKCNHKICEHFYSYEFDTDDKTHKYIMECLLCGKGVHEHRIPTVLEIYGIEDGKTKDINENSNGACISNHNKKENETKLVIDFSELQQKMSQTMDDSKEDENNEVNESEW